MFGIEKEVHVYDVTRETQNFLNSGARGIVMNGDTHNDYCFSNSHSFSDGRKKVHLKPVFSYEEDNDNDVPWDDYGTDRLRIVGPSGNTRVVLPDEDDCEYVVKRKPKRKTTRPTNHITRRRTKPTKRIRRTKHVAKTTHKKTAVKIKSEIRKNITLCAVEFYNNNNDTQRKLEEGVVVNVMPLTTDIALSSPIVQRIGTQYENGTRVKDFIDEGFDKDTVHVIVQNRQAINLRKG